MASDKMNDEYIPRSRSWQNGLWWYHEDSRGCLGVLRAKVQPNRMQQLTALRDGAGVFLTIARNWWYEELTAVRMDLQAPGPLGSNVDLYCVGMRRRGDAEGKQNSSPSEELPKREERGVLVALNAVLRDPLRRKSCTRSCDDRCNVEVPRTRMLSMQPANRRICGPARWVRIFRRVVDGMERVCECRRCRRSSKAAADRNSRPIRRCQRRWACIVRLSHLRRRSDPDWRFCERQCTGGIGMKL